MATNVPPTLLTNAADATVRATNLAQRLNDVSEAVNTLLPVGTGQWTDWTPTLTASGSNPTLGTGAVQSGQYFRLGDLVIASFGIRFGTAGRAAGSGEYYVSVPVTGRVKQTTDGMTSSVAGSGVLWRGDNASDFSGAHPHVRWHFADGTGTKLIGVVEGHKDPGDVVQATATANQASIGSTATDLTNLSLTYTARQSGRRIRLTANAPFFVDTADKIVALQIVESSTVLHRTVACFPVVGSAFGNGNHTIFASAIVENPSLGAHTYKLQAYTETSVSATMAATADAYAQIVCEELPGLSTSGLAEQTDYVGAANPWDWDDQTGRAELFGLLVYEAA